MEATTYSPYRITVNYRRGKFFIYSSILSALNNPKFICFYISTEQRVICIKGTDTHHKDCFNVEQFTNNKKKAFTPAEQILDQLFPEGVEP